MFINAAILALITRTKQLLQVQKLSLRKFNMGCGKSKTQIGYVGKLWSGAVTAHWSTCKRTAMGDARPRIVQKTCKLAYVPKLGSHASGLLDFAPSQTGRVTHT